MESQWKPACDLKYLRLRAQMLEAIRFFFNRRAVLEVETPLLCQATGTDPQLDFFSSYYHCDANKKQIKDKVLYLQTSPEFAMKRLLAAGSGSIFQICKAFRNGESGSIHNPEFTILEWYRLGFSLNELMDEVAELILELLYKQVANTVVQKISYVELFEKHTGLDPLVFCQNTYQHYAENNGISDAISICGNDYSMWLDFIFSFKVQTALNSSCLSMVYHYPAIQSSLARLNPQDPRVADRFEVFVNGVEIGNGFFELSDAIEQEKRFDKENLIRESKGIEQVNKDRLFLDALNSGLPECSGIALGVDRILMIKAKKKSLDDVMAFPIERA